MNKWVLGLAAFAFAASMSGASAQTENAGMGNWKLNVEKSKYSPGRAPKSLNIKFELVGKGVKVTTDGVNGGGSKNANTTVRTDKKAGKVTATLTRVVAKDGKSFTVAVVGTNAKGEPVNHMLVWDKQ